MRVWKAVSRWGVVAGLVVSLAGEPASAIGCFTCDSGLNCAGADQGARFCLQGPMTCTLAIPCFSGPRRAPDSGDGLTAWSLFELEGPAPSPGVDPDAGMLSVGEMMRSLRARDRGPLVDATLAFGSDLAVVLSDAAGDGFAIRRTDQPGAVRLEVYEVRGGQPGRTVADAMLRPRDRLRVPIRADGRDRLLVLQADKVPPGLAVATVARLRNSLREAARTLPERTEPLFKVRGM